MSSLFNRSAPFSLRQRRGMTSKLKRPAPCFFPSGVEEGGRSDRTTGIRELGDYTSLLLLAHRLGEGVQGPASSYRSPGTNTGTRFLIQKKIRRVTSLKLHPKKTPQSRYKTPTQRANFCVHGCQWLICVATSLLNIAREMALALAAKPPDFKSEKNSSEWKSTRSRYSHAHTPHQACYANARVHTGMPAARGG